MSASRKRGDALVALGQSTDAHPYFGHQLTSPEISLLMFEAGQRERPPGLGTAGEAGFEVVPFAGCNDTPLARGICILLSLI